MQNLEALRNHTQAKLSTYDHRIEKIEGPVRSPVHKLDTAGSVVGSVTTSESPVLLYPSYHQCDAPLDEPRNFNTKYRARDVRDSHDTPRVNTSGPPFSAPVAVLLQGYPPTVQGDVTQSATTMAVTAVTQSVTETISGTETFCETATESTTTTPSADPAMVTAI
ncbi:hypothetical protein Micbo1qcDRAFT_176918 [Microdochium bolleyi]|uniref:Uncharacterized protein n=1 Tax=Microdochium bolleyi TaxID=196109 RepID=A0A136IXG7_9PEZI|nr:hypothetical protein Micbo1qcDRAFT_176918 [Microdochium bolleyi]